MTAGIIFTLAILGIAGLFYPVKVFDLQFLPLFQRVITDFSVIALLVLLFLAGLTFFAEEFTALQSVLLELFRKLSALLKTALEK